MRAILAATYFAATYLAKPGRLLQSANLNFEPEHSPAWLLANTPKPEAPQPLLTMPMPSDSPHDTTTPATRSTLKRYADGISPLEAAVALAQPTTKEPTTYLRSSTSASLFSQKATPPTEANMNDNTKPQTLSI